MGLKPTPSDCTAGRADSCSIACDLCDLGRATSLPDTSGNSAVRRALCLLPGGPGEKEAALPRTALLPVSSPGSADKRHSGQTQGYGRSDSALPSLPSSLDTEAGPHSLMPPQHGKHVTDSLPTCGPPFMQPIPTGHCLSTIATPAFPGRAAEQEGSATVPALPHPGARACAVLARLSTGPTAAGVQKAPTRLASPPCWALDAAALLSPDCPAPAPPGFPPHTPKMARHSLPPCTASSGASDKPVLCSNLPVPPRLCPRSQPSIPSFRPAKTLCSALIPTQGSLHPKRPLTLLRRGPAGAPSSVLKAAARPEPASHAVRAWGAICLAA